MPGCAKKLAVRSSLLSIMNTSFPVGVLLCSIGDDGLPVSGPLPGRSKSISFPSPPLMTSVSVSGCDLMSDFLQNNVKKKEINKIQNLINFLVKYATEMTRNKTKSLSKKKRVLK